MDLRNLTLRIKSCIACNENQCPVIKERLDQHVLSHHSASGSSASYQHIESRRSACNVDDCPAIKERLDQHILSHHSTFRPSADSQHERARNSSGSRMPPSKTPNLAIVNSDEQSSTADLTVEELKPLRQSSYREALIREILRWAEDLPKYPNPSAENLKQNIVSELIDKVDSLMPDVNEEYYDVKLSNEVSKYLDSLPPSPYAKNRDSSLDILKLKLIHKICELNKKMNITRNTSNFVRENENFKISKGRNSVANTTQLNDSENYFKNNKTPDNSYFRNSETRTIGTNTPQCALNDSNVTFNRPVIPNKHSDDKNLVDAQVQKSFHNMRPYFGQIYGQPNLKINKQQKIEINENIWKEKISTWLVQVIKKSETNVEQNDTKILTDVLFNRLKPLLIKKMNSSRYKLLLKAEILNFLYDYYMVAVATNGSYFNKLVESLAITLLIEKANNEAPYSGSNTEYSYYFIDQRTGYNIDTECYYKPIFYKIVTDALDNVLSQSVNIANDITEILLHNKDQLRLGFCEDIKDDLQVLLKSSTDLYNITIADIVNDIMDQMSYVLCDSNENYNSIQKAEIPSWSHILSVYKSELELRESPKISITSLQRYSDFIKRSEPKLNTEERAYKERISALIAAWLKSLPKKRNKAEDIIIKETIINSLAGDIMDQIKLYAVAPQTWSEKEKYISFFIYRWLNRFEYFDDINNAKPYVDKLLKKLTDVPLPTDGSQQIKKINKFMKTTSCAQATLPPGDDLEDEISILINMQPSKIFINADKGRRNQQIHEFALDIQNTSEDITKEINKWLKKLIKPNEKQKIYSLKEQLTEKINSLIGEITSNDHYHYITSHGRKDVANKTVSSACCELTSNNICDSENDFKKFIAKYIEHISDVENLIAREAFGEILKIELQKLSAPTRKLDYCAENHQHIMSTPDRLSGELNYISIISDWLKILPLPITFNKTDNRSRSEFVNCLAKNLCDVDESRMINLMGMEYNVYLASTINKYVDQLPIPTYHKRNMTVMVDDLVQKIVAGRFHPCCQIANCKSNISTIKSTNLPNEQLSGFIGEYIRKNYEKLSEDELKLEALSARLFKEIDKLKSENLAPQNADEAEETIQPVKRLSLKLGYAKEITDCLNNLPLLPIVDKPSRDSRVNLISSLAEKMYERWQALYNDPNNTYVNTILSEYIIQWISELPLDMSKEINESIVVQQLLNRMERVNKQKFERREMSQTSPAKFSNEMCKFPYTCCNNANASNRSQYPGDAIVEAIEKWCAALPIQTEEETNSNAIKDYVATNIFKKISELNMNPKCLTDNNLFRELLSEEIEKQLGNLSHNTTPKLQKDYLKQQLVTAIMERRIEIREQASSAEYNQELENTIELSLPNPVQSYQQESPGFKIYKERLASMFILENFDYGYDDIKEKYEKRIKKEIDKYCHSVQKMNAIPLTKDQIYNELYSALFKVPLPNEASIVEEVEEIKTRCEIENWFETLPIRGASCDGEVLVRDQIIAMLAKRIHRMEKYEQNPEGKIYKEIAKWLLKLPLLPGPELNVDELASKLQNRLKSTSRNRKCTQRNECVYIDKFEISKNKIKGKGVLGTSQIAGHSIENRECPASPTCWQISLPKPKNPANIIMNIVEMWCQQLPLPLNTSQDRAIKDNLITKIIMKISELNINPETLNNDFLYDAILDVELENLLSTLPTSNEFDQSKNLRKNQLKDAIKAVKPLIQKAKAKYEYKQELHNIVDTFLKEPENLTPKIKALYVNLKDDIIDYFILYYYDRNDEESSLYKMMLNVTVEKYFTEVCHSDDTHHNSLMLGNHLLCEMAKVAVPSKAAILEEIREIRIKFHITEFFNNHSLCNDKLHMRQQIIHILAKRLSELDKASNTSENSNKIKNGIVKCLKKLDENVDQEKINSLVHSLQNIPETESSVASENRYVNPLPFSDDTQKYYQSAHIPTQHGRLSRYNEDNQYNEDGQWMSLLSVTPNDHKDLNMNRLNKTELADKSLKFSSQCADNSMESKLDYSDFKRGVVLTSTITEDKELNNEKSFSFDPNQTSGCNSSCIDKNDVAGQSVHDTASKHITKSFPPYSQGHSELFSKLSEQDSTFVQDINMQKSNSMDSFYKTANDQQSIPQSYAFGNPIRPSYNQQNRSGQTAQKIEKQVLSDPSSMSDNITTQTESLRQPIENTYHKVSKAATDKVPTLSQSNTNTNRSYSFGSSIHMDLKSPGRKESPKYEKTKPLSLDNEERDKFPNLSSSISIKNIRESSSPTLKNALLSSKSPSTHQPLSDSTVPCCKRRPSFLTFNPSDVISGSSSSAQYTQTVENKVSTDLTSDKVDGSKECRCGKRKRLCRSEIPICRAYRKKRCKNYSGLNPFYCKMPPCHYSGFYYH